MKAALPWTRSVWLARVLADVCRTEAQKLWGSMRPKAAADDRRARFLFSLAAELEDFAADVDAAVWEAWRAGVDVAFRSALAT